MLDPEDNTTHTSTTGADADDRPVAVEPQPTPVKATRKRAAKKAVAAAEPPATDESSVTDEPPAKKPARKRAAKKAAPAEAAPAAAEPPAVTAETPPAAEPQLAAPGVLFRAPEAAEPVTAPRKRARKAGARAADTQPEPAAADLQIAGDVEESPGGDGEQVAEPDDVREAAIEQASGARRRRRRGRRGRGGSGRDGDDGEQADSEDAADDGAETGEAPSAADEAPEDAAGEDGEEAAGASTRRRRRRRRSGGGDGGEPASSDDPPNTVVHVRDAKKNEPGDGVKGVKGSTRLEAKRQRRRDGRESNRRRPPILTEAEFLARREAVDRVMAVRERDGRTQVAVLEDDVLVEHYVTRASSTSYVGNIYLGRVQNVLPSMEAAFVDIGKGRNGVLYAGEVNWDAAGLEGKARAIEHALNSGDTVLVQVTKDPIGHKGARLTSQISLPGRFLVYVPGGGMTGISRRLPDTERHRLKAILKKIVPEDAGVIIRTAAEGTSEEELTRDVERLKAQWEAISAKAQNTKAAPTLVHGEPDLAIRVVRDVFNEDFKKLLVQGEGAWRTVSDYIGGVAPELAERVSRHTAEKDLFADLRVDEQLAKALDRKVWLPSGGSLVIDRTEAMTVVDVNTGKFVGAGGNLEETVTRNNLEAAEEIVRQLRLRDVGGIVVIDFIDMVLESNRDLVLRRLTECLGRDRTKHQVAEVTSLGLVQMTRKRVGEGLLEAFSEQCEHCKGRGVIVHSEPVDKAGASTDDGDEPKGKRKRGSGKRAEPAPEPVEDPEARGRRMAAIAAIHRAAAHEDGLPEDGLPEDGLPEDGLPEDGLPEDRLPEDRLPDAESTAAAEPADPQLMNGVSAGEPLLPWDAEDGPGAAEAPTPEPASQPERSRPPRRRRAASRPAGPPAHIEG